MWETILALFLGFVVILLFFVSRKSAKGNRKSARTISASKTPRTLTKAEVSLHNSRNDCWIIVKDKVYDVTSYVEEHPGGDSILNNAGGDSTEGFHGPQHASRVFDMIDDFYVGDLKSSSVSSENSRMGSAKVFVLVAAALVLFSSFLSVMSQDLSEDRGMRLKMGIVRNEDCMFAGPCKVKYDCSRRCKALGYSPTAVLCRPYSAGLTCCCLV
ncbi:cytochrome B5-like protein [Wolffia australiana]